MAVHSFSTRKLDREAEDIVQRLKLYCIKNGINFSYLVIAALKEYEGCAGLQDQGKHHVRR